MGNIKKLSRFTLQKKICFSIKGSVYKSCVRSAMFYGNETWCVGQNGIWIQQRTERAMVRSVWSEISGHEVDKRSNVDIRLE